MTKDPLKVRCINTIVENKLLFVNEKPNLFTAHENNDVFKHKSFISFYTLHI